MTTFTTHFQPSGILSFDGPDSIKFLQGQTTCNLDELSETKALYGAFCNPKGRIKSTFLLLQIEPEKLLMLVHQDQCAYLQKELKMYIAFFKSEVTDVSDHYQTVGLLYKEQGSTTSSYDVSSTNGQILITLPGIYRREIILSQSEITLDAAIAEAEQAEWLIQDIQSGLVWTNEASREQFLPHDINLPGFGGVSYEKGCYTGQEIIARMHYRGNPKYTSAVLITDELADSISSPLKAELTAGKIKSIGHVINQHSDGQGKSWILASIHKDLLQQQEIGLSINEEKTILCDINRTYLG